MIKTYKQIAKLDAEKGEVDCQETGGFLQWKE